MGFSRNFACAPRTDRATRTPKKERSRWCSTLAATPQKNEKAHSPATTIHSVRPKSHTFVQRTRQAQAWRSAGTGVWRVGGSDTGVQRLRSTAEITHITRVTPYHLAQEARGDAGNQAQKRSGRDGELRPLAGALSRAHPPPRIPDHPRRPLKVFCKGYHAAHAHAERCGGPAPKDLGEVCQAKGAGTAAYEERHEHEPAESRVRHAAKRSVVFSALTHVAKHHKFYTTGRLTSPRW